MSTLLTERAAVVPTTHGIRVPTAHGISCFVCVVPATALARGRWKLEESLRTKYTWNCNKHGSPCLRPCALPRPSSESVKGLGAEGDAVSCKCANWLDSASP